MIPCLPQQDPNPDARHAAIAQERIDYQFTYAYHDIGFAKSVPKQDRLTLPYLAKAAALNGVVEVNSIAAKLAMRHDTGQGGIRADVQAAIRGFNNKILEKIWGPGRDPRVDAWDTRTPPTMREYQDLFKAIEQPYVVDTWSTDIEFGWQRLAGTNPIMIEVANAEIIERLQIEGTAAERLGAAAADGRLFVCDWKRLEHVETGTSDNYRKWLNAPIALFEYVPADPAVGRDRPALMPRFIQLDQTPDSTNQFWPGDGWGWEMAKACVQCSDSNYHGVVEHLGRCHIRVLQVLIATYRSLAPNHPIRALLHQHFEYTMPVVNDLTLPLIKPGGRTPTLQSVDLRGAFELLHFALDDMEWNKEHPPALFADKGVLDGDVLHHDYPYRDDSLPLWDAIHRFVGDYVDLYYGANGDVANDREIQDWLRELQSREGARIRDIGDPDPGDAQGEGVVRNKKALVRLVTQIIWRISAYHNVINYSVFDAMAYPPNMPTAVYAPPPQAGKPYTEGDFRQLLPPTDLSLGTIADVFVVSNLRVNRLGHYRPFADRRVNPLVASFEDQLNQIEYEIEVRNEKRRVPYEILLPRNVARSIQV